MIASPSGARGEAGSGDEGTMIPSNTAIEDADRAESGEEESGGDGSGAADSDGATGGTAAGARRAAATSLTAADVLPSLSDRSIGRATTVARVVMTASVSPDSSIGAAAAAVLPADRSTRWRLRWLAPPPPPPPPARPAEPCTIRGNSTASNTKTSMSALSPRICSTQQVGGGRKCGRIASDA